MYYIGIDGGGTKTQACILNDKGQVLSSGMSGPSSIDTVELEVTVAHIDEAIKLAFEKIEMTVQPIKAIFIGLGGIACESDERLVEEGIRQLPYAKDAVIQARNDVSNALAGGLATKNGMAIILGTGSVCFGVNECGESHRAGGIHFKEGDAGSAYDLGRRALKSFARAIDKRYDFTEFHEAISNELGVKTFKELVNVFDELFLDRTKTASLAKVVTTYANEGDVYAKAIVEEATDEASLLVTTVLRQVPFTASEKVLATIGSLVNAKGLYRELFIEKVKAFDSEVDVIEPLLDPAIGSALMAYKIGGNVVSEKIIQDNKNMTF